MPIHTAHPYYYNKKLVEELVHMISPSTSAMITIILLLPLKSSVNRIIGLIDDLNASAFSKCLMRCLFSVMGASGNVLDWTHRPWI